MRIAPLAVALALTLATAAPVSAQQAERTVSRPFRIVTLETEKFPFVTLKTRQVAVPGLAAASMLVVEAPAPVMSRLFGVASPTASSAVSV